MEKINMKKFLLLAGVALFTANSANAAYMSEVKPYIGADYVYSRAHQGGVAKGFKKDFNSGKVDLGLQLYNNWYMEFSSQMSGELKNRRAYDGSTVKNKFQAYAMDMYGKYPLMCSNLSALVSGGAAIYHLSYKGLDGKNTDRVGYRAGVGMQYDFNKNWAARVLGRYSYLGMDRLNNFKEVTVGMLYRF